MATGEAPVLVGIYAGFWRRFVALLLDGILLAIVRAPFANIPVGGDTADIQISFQLWDGVLTFVYQWLMIAFARGQTLGKMALGIRITRPDGSRVDLGRSAARAGMSIVSGIALGLGYLWAAWDSEHRTWHDSVAETRAYRVRASG